MSQHRALRGGGMVDDTAFVSDSTFVHGTATVGARSYVGNGAYIEAGVVVGTDCIICDRVRVTADVPDGTTITCDCCGDGPTPGDTVLQFDSVVAVGTKLSTYDTTGKFKGTLAYVGNDTFPDQNSVHDYYTLVYGEALDVPGNGFEVVNSPTFGVDGAQWRRNHVVDQQALQKQFWSVDPENLSTVADDENTGWGATQLEADSHPLISMQALNARLKGYAGDIPIVIHFMSEPNVNRFEVLSNLSGAKSDQYVTVKGTLNLASVTADHRTVTAVQVAVPATNTERTITIGGFDDVASFVNMMVQTVDGLKTAFVTHKVSANVLAISQPRSSDDAGGIGTVVDFAADDTVSFWNPSRIPDWPFPDTGCPFPLLVNCRLDSRTSGRFADGQMGECIPTIGHCILGDPDQPDVNGYNLTYTGPSATMYSCMEAGQHANSLRGSGSWELYSHCVIGGADGPLVAGATLSFHDEFNIYSGNGVPGYRQLPGAPMNVFFAGDGDGQIASFGSLSCVFDLWQPQHAMSGNFVVRPNFDGPTRFKWYGHVTSGVPGILGLLTLGVGTKSQLPYSADLTVVVDAPYRQVIIDGIEFDFADVPINTLSGSTLAG